MHFKDFLAMHKAISSLPKSWLMLWCKTKRKYTKFFKWNYSSLTIIVISLLQMLRSGMLLTYIRFNAWRIPPCVRTRKTVENPPRRMRTN